MSVQALVDSSGVTATAVRSRLNRLQGEGLVKRTEEREGRGRPSHRYSLTEKGRELLGQNYTELAMMLWSELRSSDNRAIGMQVLKGVAARLAQQYRQNMPADDDIGGRFETLGLMLRSRG